MNTNNSITNNGAPTATVRLRNTKNKKSVVTRVSYFLDRGTWHPRFELRACKVWAVLGGGKDQVTRATVEFVLCLDGFEEIDAGREFLIRRSGHAKIFVFGDRPAGALRSTLRLVA